MGKKEKTEKLTYSEHYVCMSPKRAYERVLELEYKGYKMSEIYTRIVWDKFGKFHREVGLVKPASL